MTTATARTLRTVYFTDGSGAAMLLDIRGKRVSVTLSWNGCVIVGAPQNAAATVRINPSDVVIGRAVFAKWAKTLPAEFVAAHNAVKSLSSEAADAHLEALAAEHAARGIASSVEVIR
jgi:hypothetical protein